tara:strand:- start:549 stop:824 length:276 start_codon:yes stop_codon:yes gene_type:complete
MTERIDLTQFEVLTTPWDFGKKYPHIESAKVAVELIAELKRMYAREDELLDALRIIRDDLDEIIAQEVNLSLSSRLKMIKKIRNFANDASQ